MGKKVKIDAWQKFQNPLLTQYNVEQLAELKRSNWSGLLMGVDQLYSTMYHEWDSLQKDVNDMAGAVRALEWTVMPKVRDGEEPTPEAQEVARVVSEAIWRRGRVPLGGYAHGFPEMIAAMVHAIFRGWNVHQIEWANDGELVYPERYIQLPPQFLIWETRTGKPDRLLLVPDGQSGEGVPFADDMFLVALNNNGPDHPVYNAVFYSLVNWFLAYKFGLGWFMQFTQKFGMPKQVFHYSSAKDKEALIAEMEDERAINSLFIRGDRKYELVNAPQAGASLPQAVLLERAEAACHKAILGQTLTSDTSSHGGSLAQAKVHAGVRAELVMQYAEFVAEVLNRQLVPAIVRANFGRVEGIEMPEIRSKLPKTQANIEMAQAWQAVLQIPGMKVKKSEVYDSLGVSAPEEGEEVFEAQAAHGAPMGGMEGMQPEEVPQAQEGGEEAVQTAKRKVDPAQEWLEPLKKKLREARENGASLAELRESVRKWRPNTAALAGAFANNIERGLLGSETAKAANPFGCNQYGEGWASEHNGLRSEPGKPMKKGDKPKEEDGRLPDLIGSEKQIKWAEDIRDSALRRFLNDDNRTSLIKKITTARWWIDNRDTVLTEDVLKKAVAENEKKAQREQEEVEQRKKNKKEWEQYKEKLRRGEIRFPDPDGKLRRMTEYINSARADEEALTKAYEAWMVEQAESVEE